MALAANDRDSAVPKARRPRREAEAGRGSVHPLVKMDPARVFPGTASDGMQMTREDRGIHVEQQFVPPFAFAFRVNAFGGRGRLGGLRGPLLLEGGPIHTLQIEVRKAVELIGEL